MIIVGAVLAVLVLGAALAWAVGRAEVPGVPAPVSTQSALPLPEGPLRPDDIHDARFDQAVRGYRMGQVDAALARLADEIAHRDAEIARLRGGAEPALVPGGPSTNERPGEQPGTLGGTRP